MKKRDDKTMRFFLDYYSFDHDGTRTIAIHHTPGVFPDKEANFAILGNGGVPLMTMCDEDMEQAGRLCVEMGISISPVIIH